MISLILAIIFSLSLGIILGFRVGHKRGFYAAMNYVAKNKTKVLKDFEIIWSKLCP